MSISSISNHQQSGRLVIEWEDGNSTEFSHAQLRALCRCSACQSLRLRTGQPLAFDDDIRLTDIQPAGAYGVQLIFSDSHDRGIYPWEYLADCSAAK
ncbi:MAG: DUF971 domain-containing protein [Pseudomonadota bacterium]